MNNRNKLLVHINRLNTVFNNAIEYGPDGSLTGKFKEEHPLFIHHSIGFYLIGCFAYLASEKGDYSWNKPGNEFTCFDTFAKVHPVKKESYFDRGITKSSLSALACIRNAVAHNDCDLSLNRDPSSLSQVKNTHLPGVILEQNEVRLEKDLLGFIRIATYSVRHYHGEE